MEIDTSSARFHRLLDQVLEVATPADLAQIGAVLGGVVLRRSPRSALIGTALEFLRGTGPPAAADPVRPAAPPAEPPIDVVWREVPPDPPASG